MGFRDERGVIVNWLVKILLVCAIAGVIVYDAGSIATNFFGLDGIADDAALAVATDLQSGDITANPQLLKQTANAVAKPAGARVAEVSVDLEGVVHVTLKREADTLIVSRVSAIEDWGQATATATATAGTK